MNTIFSESHSIPAINQVGLLIYLLLIAYTNQIGNESIRSNNVPIQTIGNNESKNSKDKDVNSSTISGISGIKNTNNVNDSMNSPINKLKK